MHLQPDFRNLLLTVTLDHTLQTLKDRLSAAPPVGAIVQFDFGSDGCLFLDGTGSVPEVRAGEPTDPPAVTTLSCSLETFTAILEGRQDPTLAYMTGKLKIQGSMGLALKLSSLLGE